MSQATADSAQNQTAVEEASAPASESIQETTTTPEAGNEGQGGSGEAEDSAATEQGQTTPSVEERIASVDTPEAFEAMMSEVQQNPEAFADQTENQQPEGEQAATEGQEAQAPPEGGAAPVTEATEQQAQAAEGAEGAESQEGQPPEGEQAEQEGQESETTTPEGEEGQEEGMGGDKPPQFRLRPTEKVDAEALRIMKAAEAAHAPISLSAALGIAKRNLGIEDKPATTPDQSQGTDSKGDGEGDGEDPTANVTLPEAKQELKDLRKKHSQALRDGDLDEAADVMDQIGETEDLIEVISDRDARQEQANRQQHDTAFEASVARATDLFSDFGDPKSAFYKRCTEIDEALRETDDPRYFDASKPLLIAQMAAKELDIAPGAKTRKPAETPATKPDETPAAEQQAAPATPPQQTSTSPQPPRTEKPGQLPAASGAARTAGAPTGAAASLAEQVAKVSSPADFEKLAKEVHEAGRA